MLFKNVSIAGLAHIDAPHTLTSDEINARLQPTLDRLGIKTDVLNDIAGVHSRRLWDADVQASDAATLAARKALLDAGIGADKIGLVDVYQVTHHGLEISNNPVLINTVQPRVAVFNNGPKKGCHPSVTAALRRSPGIQVIYQLHRNLKATEAENTEATRIANDGRKKEAGEGIHLQVAADAKSYTVKVGSKGKTFTHKTRSGARRALDVPRRAA